MRTGFAILIYCLVAAGFQAAVAAEQSECDAAKLTAPAGSNSEDQAAAKKVKSQVKLEWRPGKCVMTVEVYQKHKLLKKTKDVVTGTTVRLAEAGTGATEIKIWREGSTTPADSTWVWIR